LSQLLSIYGELYKAQGSMLYISQYDVYKLS